MMKGTIESSLPPHFHLDPINLEVKNEGWRDRSYHCTTGSDEQKQSWITLSKTTITKKNKNRRERQQAFNLQSFHLEIITITVFLDFLRVHFYGLKNVGIILRRDFLYPAFQLDEPFKSMSFN